MRLNFGRVVIDVGTSFGWTICVYVRSTFRSFVRSSGFSSRYGAAVEVSRL